MKNKMTEEEFERIRQIPKEDFEKWEKEQIKLEMQSPQYIDTKILEDTLDWSKNEEYTNRFE